MAEFPVDKCCPKPSSQARTTRVPMRSSHRLDAFRVCHPILPAEFNNLDRRFNDSFYFVCHSSSACPCASLFPKFMRQTRLIELVLFFEICLPSLAAFHFNGEKILRCATAENSYEEGRGGKTVQYCCTCAQASRPVVVAWRERYNELK